MARTITTVQMRVELYNRLANLRGHVSGEVRGSESSIGLEPMIGLLLDHWQQHPPERGWLEVRVKDYPRRGRRPKQITGTVVEDRPTRRDRGHQLFPSPSVGASHKVFYCRRCTMQFSTWEHKSPPAPCPKDGEVMSIYQVKRWSKNELLALGFSEAEVAWVDHEQIEDRTNDGSGAHPAE